MVKWFVAGAFACVALCCVPEIFAGVVINEIHYDPDVKTEAVEFIELYNTGPVADLSGWAFDQGVDFTFPAGTMMAVGDYLTVAANPAALQNKFGVNALGPWSGGLSNDGENIRLIDPLGNTVSEVDYGRGFPWPLVGGPPGYSIELANPVLDPDLAGNWRASDANAGSGVTLVPEDDTWRYFKGASEASTPIEAWRQTGFDDSAWLSGPLAIGYGETFINTTLADMQGNYRAVMLRKTFVVTNLAAIGNLQLEVIVDDGFNAWINGTHVTSFNLPGTNVAFDANANSALENLDWQTFNVAGTPLQLGTNVLAIQVHNANLGNSSDAVLNARLNSIGSLSPGPTPNAVNSVLASNLPPRVRQVKHEPEAPTTGVPVTISAKVTDPDSGVDAVRLHYQIVDPGQYIALDDPAYASTWTVVAMVDADGDDTFEAVLPGSLQVHRRLLRYRVFAEDNAGQVMQAPLANDPEPNFALFTYDGVPGWSGAVEPGVTATQNFGTNVMNSLPVYHLISKKSDVEDCTWNDTYTGSDYRWSGTIVHDGEVYDHIGYRARGGVWRYAMGKNMWKFNFNTANRLETRDDYGKKAGEAWDKLNFSAVIQQGNFWHRGEQGMFETTGFKLFDLMDVEGPNTHFAHFRIIDEAAEVGATQFDGDFWGLYLAIEQLDSRFLDEHDLPDGNLYKMESGTGTLNNQGATAVSDRSDLDTFLDTYNNTTPSDQWWRDNLDLERYYGYRSVVEGIHHYDIAAGKNYFYYNNPDTARWQVVPWDLDLTWGDNMFGNGNEPFKSRVINRPVFEQEYQNRLRSFRDLIYNGDQGHRLLDDIASLIDNPGGPLSFVDADRARWDHNPILDNPAFIDRFTSNKAGTGRFYQGNGGSIMPPTPDFEGMVQQMKNYIASRGSWIDTNLLDDPDIPDTPVISYSGGTGPTGGFPLDALAFDSSAFVDGSGSLQAVEWRIGEITDPAAPGYDPDAEPVYEVTEVWESRDAAAGGPSLSVALPPTLLQPGRTYRARVRHVDSTDKASHWSAAFEFTATGPVSAQSLIDNLRVSELMYNSAAGSDFDFIEFVNTNTTDTLDLSNVQITDGIDYVFPVGTLMAPGSYLVVAKAPGAAFDAAYGLTAGSPTVLGPFIGGLRNSGERLEVEVTGGAEIIDFTYNDARGWPCAADGAGHSLVPLVFTDQRGALDLGINWRQSRFRGGSPGAADPAPPAGLVINEFAAHTDLNDPAFPAYDSNDWIELYNRGAAAASFADVYLSDDGDDLVRWALPAGSLAAGDWTSFDETTGFHNPITAGFGLNKAGEKIFLSHLPAGSPGEVLDCVCFEGQENGASAGRLLDGEPGLIAMPPTRDASNVPGPTTVILSEVHYHPATNLVAGSTNDITEFVEIHNPLSVAVPLFSPQGGFRVSGAADYAFPFGVILQPGESLLLVSFNPLDAAESAAFAAYYGVTLPPLVFGPFSGGLGNSNGRVSLELPQAPDALGEPVSWVVVDEMIYGDTTPWDPDADGLGDSLNRIHENLNGNDPANWTAAAPTPGSATTAVFNWPPVLDPIPTISVAAGSPVTFTNNWTDWNPNQTHSFTLGSGAPAGASIDASGVFSWTPPATMSTAASNQIVVIVTDDGVPVQSSTQMLTVLVTSLPSNQPPVFADPGSPAAFEGQTLQLLLSATDPDVGQTLTWSLLSGPAGATLNATGLVSWVASSTQNADFVVEVCDSSTPPACVQRTIKVSVQPIPEIASIAAAANTADLTSPSELGIQYALDAATNLELQDWQQIGTLPGTGAVLNWSHLLPADNLLLRFYRVRVLP